MCTLPVMAYLRIQMVIGKTMNVRRDKEKK